MSSKTYHNPLKARLAEGKPAIGILQSMPSPHLTQLLAYAGYDWIFCDMEHGPITIESAQAMITATKGTQTAPLVRVPWNLHWLVKPVLDSGAMGVIFPTIRTVEEAQAAVAAVRYPPVGVRGMGPHYAISRWGLSQQEYIDASDDNVMAVLLVEHRDAVEDIESIVAVPGIDAMVIAPYDLSASYGHRDGPNHPEVQAAIATVETAVLAAGVPLGGLAPKIEQARGMIEKGYQLILAGMDRDLIADGAKASLEGIRG